MQIKQIKLRRIGRILLAVLVVALLAYGLGWSKWLAVDSISFQGTDQVDLIKKQLLNAESKLVIGEPLARINPRAQESIIKDLEWVQSAQIRRNWWSGKVTVQITPRTPVAVFSVKDPSTNSFRYLASDGVEFSTPQSYPGLAVISLGQKTIDQRLQIANFVANLPAELVAALSGLEISKNGTIQMQSNLRKPSLNIIWGSGNSAADITVKSKVLMGLLALAENKRVREIDLTIANSPIVK
ncbi:MAG: cell division protein FtsQ/DivIB [Candidatus Nanopelagicaceae bacterium]